MLKQNSLPETSTQQEIPSTDKCTRHPCYSHTKGQEYGFCQIQHIKILHTLAETQRICDYQTKQELKRQIRILQKESLPHGKKNNQTPIQIAKKIIKKDHRILKALNNGKQKPKRKR